jgi:hypothetical protein
MLLRKGRVLTGIKAQYDKIKRKALLAPNFGGPEMPAQQPDDGSHRTRPFGNNMGNSIDLGAVVGGMEANGVSLPNFSSWGRPAHLHDQIQRTPIVNRNAQSFPAQRGSGSSENWAQPLNRGPPPPARMRPPQPLQRQPAGQADRSYRSGATSDRSDSANEVESLLVGSYQPSRMNTGNGGWITAPPRPSQRGSYLTFAMK